MFGEMISANTHCQFVSADKVKPFLQKLADLIAPSDLKRICQLNAEELYKISA